MDDSTDDLDDRIREIGFLLERERFAQAGVRLRHALSQSPDHPLLVYFSAYLQYRQEDPAGARRTLENLLAQSPENPAARLLLFEVLDSLGEFAAAEAVILEQLRGYPDDSTAFALYGRLMLKTLHLEKASQLATEALRRAPESPVALSVATLTDLVLHGANGDLPALQKLIEQDPEAEQTARLLIAALIQANRHAEARAIAEELFQTRPQDQSLLGLALELRAVTHWSMRPILLLSRFGWGGSIAVWAGTIALIAIGGRYQSDWVFGLVGAYLLFVVYSWVWPPLIRRILAR